jgi:hypothetical protein
MVIIPLQAVPSQQVNVLLNNQTCLINVYQRSTGLFTDLYVNNALIVAGVIGRNLTPMVRDAYLGFIGDLAWFNIDDDSQSTDPIYTEVGIYHFLTYYLPSELPVGVQ